MILVVKIFKRRRRTWPRVTQPLLRSDWRTHRTSPKAELASVHCALIQIWPVVFSLLLPGHPDPTWFGGSVLASPTGGGGSSFIFLYLFWHWGFRSALSVVRTGPLGWFIWSNPLPHIWLWLHIIRSDSRSQWGRSVSCQFVVFVVTWGGVC